jgi:hypothetical protein
VALNPHHIHGNPSNVRKFLRCKHSSDEGVSLSFFIKENYLEEVDTIYILRAI